ncbi:MAG TPA: molybdopterin-dependent oxidoreductase [Candidatus Sulfopaludibacter sp.]|nr:molybdopterin-dependent oxidoreductase [Candidatus Sulfopaludibacter sp.]
MSYRFGKYSFSSIRFSGGKVPWRGGALGCANFARYPGRGPRGACGTPGRDRGRRPERGSYAGSAVRGHGLACEEGWSYIAEWSGVPLSHVLDLVGTLPQARYVVYRSIQPAAWESIDMAHAMHPQTLVTLGMNGGELPVGFGGPVRLRVPRQLGYKNVKYVTQLTVTDSLKKFGKGLGSASPEEGYAWYAGI